MFNVPKSLVTTTLRGGGRTIPLSSSSSVLLNHWTSTNILLPNATIDDNNDNNTIQKRNYRTVAARTTNSNKGKARSAAIKLRIQTAAAKYKKPTLEIANAMPLSIVEMDNMSLLTMGALGNHSAHVEILKRHIMSVDKITYDEACTKFLDISDANDQTVWLLSLPYRLGIITAVSAGVISIPMVFHLPTAHWFNTHYVTTDIPEPQDIETFLEVGAWTWNWCEPALGTVSFVLLTLQFARAQIQNLGYRPYTQFIKQRRAENLASQFPQYDASLLINFSKSSSFVAATRRGSTVQN